MFDVVIGLKKVAQVDTLAGACRRFIEEVQKMVSQGGCSYYVLYEACYIESTVDGVRGIMNFNAISQFSHASGILDHDGSLRDRALPHIPKEFEREIFLQSFTESFDAWLEEMYEKFQAAEEVALSKPESEEETKPALIVL